MYIYGPTFSQSGIGRWPLGRFLAEPTSSFSPSCEQSAATPGFSSAERSKIVNLLSTTQNAEAVRWNRSRHPAKSGVPPDHIAMDLARYVDFAAVKAALQQSTGKYVIGDATIDAVFVEAAHQFQAKIYFQADEQTGGVGPSTLDSLGIVKHKLKPAIGNVYGRSVLKDLSDKISGLTNAEFNAKNWFDFIVAPSFLGHRINKHGHGIHLLLLRKLREAETYLLTLPRYTGMTPVQLGQSFGLHRKSVRYSGGRISREKQAMHGVGLALDIDVAGNPWVGAGWIDDDKAGRDWLVDQIKKTTDPALKTKYQGMLSRRNERYRFLETLKLAAAPTSINGSFSTIASFLHGIAVKYGHDTQKAYDFLLKRNDEFKAYLRSHPSELRHWQSSATFSDRDPQNGFLNLHGDLVLALRHKALLAWGAIDFGPNASGDVMHFDLRTIGAGKIIAKKMRGYVPEPGRHPVG